MRSSNRVGLYLTRIVAIGESLNFTTSTLIDNIAPQILECLVTFLRDLD